MLRQARVGCLSGRGELNRGSVDQGREGKIPHKRAGTVGSRNSSENIPEKSETKAGPSCDGQHDSLILSNPQRGDKVKDPYRDIKKNLGISVSTGDHDYCIMDPIERKHNSGLEIQTEGKLKRMGTLKQSFSENSEILGDSGNRLLCLENNAQSTTLHVSKPRPQLPSDKRSLSGLGKLPILISTILPDRQNLENFERETNTKSTSDSTTVARSALVLSVADNDYSRTNMPLSTKGIAKKSHEGTPPLNKEQVSSFSGISSVRKQLQEHVFSKSASEIMLQARRSSTTRAYKTPWEKWVLWCNGRQANPFEAPVELIVEFLTELYQQGLEYRTINVYRSAISAYHTLINGTPVGQMKEVCLLLSGIDNLRPPTPKYNVIWEVGIVVDCLKKLGDDETLSNKDLTHKTVMLMALTAIKRCSDLHLLDNRFMAIGEDKVVFKILGKPKNFKCKGKIPEPVTFWASGVELCPVSIIRAYVNRTETWRKGNSQTKFFLSYIEPHHPVTSSTIGRWLKTVLGNVGVDTS